MERRSASRRSGETWRVDRATDRWPPRYSFHGERRKLSRDSSVVIAVSMIALAAHWTVLPKSLIWGSLCRGPSRGADPIGSER
jgi:hypothetical protein